MRYWQTKKFSLLEHKWYEKLKKQGFIDEEKKLGIFGHERVLKQRSSNVYKHAPQIVRENKETYFDLLFQGLLRFNCDTPVDQLIMNQRSLGVAIKDIALHLKQKRNARDRKTIRYTIRKYEHRWKIIHWNQTQLDPNWKKKTLPTK